MPIYRTDDEIARVAEGFLDLTLPKPEWTHAAHFATALWLLRHRTDLDLASQLPDLIRAYNVASGGINSDSEGYHETITQASLRAARAELARYPSSAPLCAIVEDVMASPLGKSDWLFAYWTKARLLSVEARRAWVEPDVQAMPY